MLLASAIVLQFGCGGGGARKGTEGDAAEATLRSKLGEVHDLVTTYAKSHQQQAPKKLSDLLPYERMNPISVQALKDQSIVLVYSADLGDSGAILAYEKDADKSGGLVLLASGTVKQMSASELAGGIKKKP
jgi:hypothetical protein